MLRAVFEGCWMGARERNVMTGVMIDARVMS